MGSAVTGKGEEEDQLISAGWEGMVGRALFTVSMAAELSEVVERHSFLCSIIQE